MNFALHSPTDELIRFVTARRKKEGHKEYSQKFSTEDVREMLSFLSPDLPYQDWLNVGMALHSGGYDVSLWADWSQQGAKYKPGECHEKWGGFNFQGGISLGTLLYMARQHGYSEHVDVGPEFQKPENEPEGRIRAIHWSELASLPRKQYLVKGLLDRGAYSVVYGASNCGKTFYGLDLACHIAQGWDWHGRKTKSGSVVYIAAEGGLSIQERLTAFRKQYSMEQFADVYIIPGNVRLCGGDIDLEAFLACIKEIENIQLIVIDTLARAFAGGDENNAKDMGAFVQNCDAIRKNTGAHVMVIHHSGKDEDKGARGSNALLGAIDTEIHVTQAYGIIKAVVTKQRDGITGHSFAFKLREHQVGLDEDGEPVTSCALVTAEAQDRKDRLSGQTAKAYELLIHLIKSSGFDETPGPGMRPQKVVLLEDFRMAFAKAGIAKTDKTNSADRAFKRAKENLKSGGIIEENDDHIWLTDKSDK